MNTGNIRLSGQSKEHVLQPILEYTHHLIRQAFARLTSEQPRFAIDATVGNGHDTVMLAHEVGTEGLVAGCDVQPQALLATRHLLKQAGLQARVQLHEIGHESLHVLLDPSWKEQVTAITANLGYLPGSDKKIITRSQTTLKMMETLLPFLRISGILTIVAYGGHVGGAEEVNAVHDFVKHLPLASYRVLSYTFVNPSGTPPILYAIERVNSFQTEKVSCG